jgi:hypothetical protein
MKRKATLLTIAIAFIVMTGNISAHQPNSSTSSTSSPKEKGPVTVKEKGSMFVNYDWYYDEDMMQPVGAYSDVNTEVVRLRNMFPANIFSTTPTGTTHQYEYGYYQFAPFAIIYSDL